MSKWVKYYIDSPKGQNYIRENLNTTVQPTLNVKSLVEMPIPVYSTQYMQKAYNLVMNQLRDNPDYINDLYRQLDGVLYSEGSEKDFSRLTNQLLEYEALGIMRFTGKTKINDTVGEGIEHEEFYVDDDSILACYKKIMNIKEDTDL